MESNGRCSFSSSDGPPSSKKRRTLLDPESELDLMKRERENDKELIEEQKETIYEQTMEIRDLKKQLKKSVNTSNVDPEMEETLTEMEKKETELRLQNDELQKRIEDEKADHKKSLAEMNLTLTNQIGKLENVINEKNTKIKNLEEQLPSIIAIKSEPDDSKKLLQDKIDQLQLSNNESAKKIKELEAELQAKVKLENLHQTKLSAVEEHYKHQQKLSSDKFKQEIETRNKTIKELNEKILTLEKSHKSVLDKVMLDKKNEIQNLVAKHEQEMKALKEKFENGAKKAKNEMDGLKSNVQNLTKKISEDQKAATRVQNEISELKDKNTVAEEKEHKLKAEIDELKQKLREASSTSNDHQHGQENNEPRFVKLDEVRDGSKIICNRLKCKNIVVVKVEKLMFVSDRWRLYSTLDPNEEPVELNSPKSCCQFQINGELKIASYYVSQLMPRLHSFKFTKLDLGDSRIEYDDFKKLVSSNTVKTFNGGNIQKQFKILEIGEIMKMLINVENCDIRYFGDSGDIQKFVELPVFQNLKTFTVCPTSSSFEFNSFVEFIKKYPNVEFFFIFDTYNYSFPSKAKTIVRKKEKQFRELLPSGCKVVVEF